MFPEIENEWFLLVIEVETEIPGYHVSENIYTINEIRDFVMEVENGNQISWKEKYKDTSYEVKAKSYFIKKL
jgi:hypothetical protein